MSVKCGVSCWRQLPWLTPCVCHVPCIHCSTYIGPSATVVHPPSHPTSQHQRTTYPSTAGFHQRYRFNAPPLICISTCRTTHADTLLDVMFLPSWAISATASISVVMLLLSIFLFYSFPFFLLIFVLSTSFSSRQLMRKHVYLRMCEEFRTFRLAKGCGLVCSLLESSVHCFDDSQ